MNEISNKTELENLPEGVMPTINLRIITTFVFLVFSSLLFLWDKVNVSITIPLLLVFWILEQLFVLLLIKTHKIKYIIKNVFLFQFVFDLFILTIITYYIGASGWIGAIFYIFTIIYAIFFLLEKWKRIFLVSTACLFYSGLLFLEYSGIIPPWEIFSNNCLEKDFSYVFSTFLLVNSSFIFIGVTVNIFAGILRRKIKELNITQKELNESKVNLEKKVKVRTKKLEKLTYNLEEKVQERTEELQEKIDELEKFNKLAINREIKMVELKEQLKKLKK